MCLCTIFIIQENMFLCTFFLQDLGDHFGYPFEGYQMMSEVRFTRAVKTFWKLMLAHIVDVTAQREMMKNREEPAETPAFVANNFLGTTSKFDGNSLSLQCKDRGGRGSAENGRVKILSSP